MDKCTKGGEIFWLEKQRDILVRGISLLRMTVPPKYLVRNDGSWEDVTEYPECKKEYELLRYISEKIAKAKEEQALSQEKSQRQSLEYAIKIQAPTSRRS